MTNSLISKIFVINLEIDSERKDHIINEFALAGINDYKFHQAVPHDSPRVKKMMRTPFVFKFPPCFRCGRNSCGCRNNFLIPQQIGNWCSYIDIMKIISELDAEELVMVCEDDVKFIPEGPQVLKRLTSLDYLKSRKINLNRPLLLRAGAADTYHRGFSRSPDNCTLSKNSPIPANPSFICNSSFAKSFSRHLHKIKTTSDVYIHQVLPRKNASIQHFTLNPLPMHELSWGAGAKFYSRIHPKGIDDYDKKRVKKHKKKISHKEWKDSNKGGQH